MCCGHESWQGTPPDEAMGEQRGLREAAYRTAGAEAAPSEGTQGTAEEPKEPRGSGAEQVLGREVELI